ncbi:MAG: AAA family ATPase [Synechococcales bacterium]|nr:AAA family ATPase [Synechococcales bacterium]
MSNELHEGFADNWAYLKVELSWLDRILMMALARHRQDKKGVDHIAQTGADRVSSHWWKGVISIDGKVAYDEYRNPSKASTGAQKISYQQQIDTRIHLSRQQGVALALPELCDRLRLTLFEKNLVLMALAPEVNRRYARLYHYLQSDRQQDAADLPTVELVLRILCRNDKEWRMARNRISAESPLLHHQLVKLLFQPQETFLTASIRLSGSLVDYLLAESPSAHDLEMLLQEPAPSLTPWLAPPLLPVRFSNELSIHAVGLDVAADGLTAADSSLPPLSEPSAAGLPPQSPSPTGPGADQPLLRPTADRVDWSALVLPAPLLATLQHLAARVQRRSQVDDVWGFAQHSFGVSDAGTVALLVGAAGTGKTLAARAIATSLETPLRCLNLSTASPTEAEGWLAELLANPPQLLLIKAADQWLGQTSPLEPSRLQQLFLRQRQSGGLLLLSIQDGEAIAPGWHPHIDYVLQFPLPDEASRLTLWKRAFPPQVPLNRRRIRWTTLSRIPLTGKEIMAIARDAAVQAAAEQAAALTMAHITTALNRRGYGLPVASRQRRMKAEGREE